MRELTQAIKTRKRKNEFHPEWGSLIKQKRLSLDETQAEFGRRFNVSYVAVHLWEAGKRDVPGRVTWWLFKQQGMR